ncbi:MAG: hypothetical protein K6D92_04450 [Erysipelotrichaceae bacterium]|nr:hypothetical protein [Erysipelotrichaceae bacterium]
MKDTKTLLTHANKLISDYTGRKTALLNEIEKAEVRAAAADKKVVEAVRTDNASNFSAAKREVEFARDLVEFNKARLAALTAEADRIEDFRKLADEGKQLRDEIHAETIKALLKYQEELKTLIDKCSQEESAVTEILENLGEVLEIGEDEIQQYKRYSPLNQRILVKNILRDIERVKETIDNYNENINLI